MIQEILTTVQLLAAHFFSAAFGVEVGAFNVSARAEAVTLRRGFSATGKGEFFTCGDMKALNLQQSWYYTWTTSSICVQGQEYVPMINGVDVAKGVLASKEDKVKDWTKANAHYLYAGLREARTQSGRNKSLRLTTFGMRMLGTGSGTTSRIPPSTRRTATHTWSRRPRRRRTGRTCSRWPSSSTRRSCW
jgi:hypothetical protein